MFFAGCHVDWETNTVTGPTEREAAEQSVSNIIGLANPIGLVEIPIANAVASQGRNRLIRVIGNFGTRFRNYDRVLELGESLGGKIDEHHWVPQTFHSRLQGRFGNLSNDILNFTEKLDDGFHSWLHGQGAKGTLQDAYNGRINAWLDRNNGATLDDFLKEVKRLRDEYLQLYEQYITDHP